MYLEKRGTIDKLIKVILSSIIMLLRWIRGGGQLKRPKNFHFFVVAKIRMKFSRWRGRLGPIENCS